MGEVKDQDQAWTLFRKGLEKLREGDRLSALSFVERAHHMQPKPVTFSYLGLLTALERGLVSEGIALCQKALEDDPENPRFLFNLGRVYYKGGRKAEAFDLARRSVLLGGGEEPKRWLDSQGIRKPPVFRFLPRSHFINKYTGLALSRLSRIEIK